MEEIKIYKGGGYGIPFGRSIIHCNKKFVDDYIKKLKVEAEKYLAKECQDAYFSSITQEIVNATYSQDMLRSFIKIHSR